MSIYKYSFKIARNFSVQFYGQCIPKNAVYGRLNKNVVIYVSNFKQFEKADDLSAKIQIYKLDIRSNKGTFRPYVLDLSKNLDIALCLQLLQFIKEHELYNVKCENQLMLNRISKPTRREIPESQYNVSYPQRKIYKWEETFLTETDATCNPRTKESNRSDVIISKQKQLDYNRRKREFKYNYIRNEILTSEYIGRTILRFEEISELEFIKKKKK